MAYVLCVVATSLILTGVGHAQGKDGVQIAIEFLKVACGADEALEFSATGDGSIALLRKEKLGALSGDLKGEVVVKKSDLRGALDIMKDEIKEKENQNIRKCMEPYIKRILDAIFEGDAKYQHFIDYEDVRVSLDYTGITSRTKNFVSEWSIKNNTNTVQNIMIGYRNTQVMVRSESRAVEHKIEGVSLCYKSTKVCLEMDAYKWTHLEPQDIIKFRVVTVRYKKIPSPNVVTVNVRFYLKSSSRAYFRDFSFADMRV